VAGLVISLALDGGHNFSKPSAQRIRLLAGLGIEGDAHAGATVQHRSRVAKDPTQPNLRQVHLIHAELFDELAAKGFSISPGQLGENVTTCGIDLLGLSAGTRLRLGDDALIEVTGLRIPCHQINGIAPGLMDAMLDRAADGSLIRKCGIMAVVLAGGEVRVGAPITIDHIPGSHTPLQVV
jgi:MOSC domain-containing protein YiiM